MSPRCTHPTPAHLGLLLTTELYVWPSEPQTEASWAMWQGLQMESLFPWSFRVGCLILQGKGWGDMEKEIKMRKGQEKVQ